LFRFALPEITQGQRGKSESWAGLPDCALSSWEKDNRTGFSKHFIILRFTAINLKKNSSCSERHGGPTHKIAQVLRTEILEEVSSHSSK